ncbi:hypothetical protein OPV22_012380 [Ensete ventricosum]|uniref:Uncharacterized protein n=1 Tax=Ensete ventricosum TaxID=4639 RepID=A0AAV8PH02_ENSVE|nr:hypothetical protein OPV22_012380 [Ensete ventricosum]RWW15361.1 hypothetical protein GW17_00020812 [Ensete ventricosum]RZR93148.1 hypothetical protein BHM03_00021572 [Ensete ventricosum]
MRLASRSLHKGTMMAGNNRKKSYGLLLLLALGAALLSVVMLQKLRERHVLGLLLQDRERELLAFELLLQKERESTKEMKSRLYDLRNKTISLSQEKAELYNKLTETEMMFAELKRTKKEMEATLEDKENQIIQITKQAAASVVADRKASDLTEILKKKEDEIEEMKHKLSEVHQPENIPTEDDIVRNVTGLDYTKENEDLQDRSLGSTNPGDRKNTEEKTQIGGANETETGHEDNSSKGTWVKLETIIENEGLKDESESSDEQSAAEVSQDNRLEKIEVSPDSEHSQMQGEMDQEIPPEAEERTKKLKDEETVVAGDNKPKVTEMEEKEQWGPEDDSSRKLENSPFSNERKVSTDLKDVTAIDSHKMKSRRRKRTKTKSRRRQVVPKGMELEKSAWEDEKQVIRTETEDLTTDAGSRKSDDKEQANHTNDGSVKMTTSLHENEVPQTMDYKERNKEDETEGSIHITDDNPKSEHAAKGSFSSTNKLDGPESLSDSKSQNQESSEDIQQPGGESSTGSEHEEEEKEVVSTDDKLTESEKPQNDDLVKPNDSNPHNDHQELTLSST